MPAGPTVRRGFGDDLDTFDRPSSARQAQGDQTRTRDLRKAAEAVGFRSRESQKGRGPPISRRSAAAVLAGTPS